MTSDAILPPEQPVAQPPAPSQPSTLRKVFVGKDGLRAVWSFLIFLLLSAALVAIGVLIGHIVHPVKQAPKIITEMSLRFAFVNEAVLACATLLATWIMSKIERRGRSYGYGGSHQLKHLLSGMCWGLILISLLVLTLWRGGLLVIERRLIFGVDVFRYGLLWLLAFFLVGVFEESLTRGFLLYTLTRGLAGFYRWAFKTRHSAALGFWSAATLLSVIFFLGHTGNPGESPVGLLSVFVAGMFFCLAIWRTGSIWWAIGMHASWDWGQSYLFGVADSGLMVQHRLLATHPQGRAVLSGGTTGPEGSIFILAVLTLGSLVVLLILPRGRYYEAPTAVDEPQPQPAIVAV